MDVLYFMLPNILYTIRCLTHFFFNFLKSMITNFNAELIHVICYEQRKLFVENFLKLLLISSFSLINFLFVIPFFLNYQISSIFESFPSILMFTIHIYNHLQHRIELISTLKFEFFNRFLPCGIISNKNLINISESKRKKN